MRSGQRVRPFGLALVTLLTGLGCNGVTSEVATGADAWPVDVCAIESAGTRVEIVRPDEAAGDSPIDDVNWFARPVPNADDHWIVAFASGNQNYLYDLTSGARIKIPDRSDAVATPDGRYVTVPSHYTADHTVNFYETATLLERLEAGVDADDVAPVFEHRDADVEDVYYQSVGLLPRANTEGPATTRYRMMFSGSRHRPAPGFRIVDYAFQHVDGALHVSASPAMALCPEIVEDMNTPFISKDGRYVVAHDNSDAARRPSLKIFEITGVDPAGQTTACVERVDFGFAAGKADFAFDNSSLTFHVAKNDYLMAFIDGGLTRPVTTDVAVVGLTTDAGGTITGHDGVARVTTSVHEGTGNYFPAFFPDGRLFYISNATPKDSDDAKRFRFTVVDPSAELVMANALADDIERRRLSTIGALWRDVCAADAPEFQRDEAAWQFLSLSPAQCRALVDERWTGETAARGDLMAACDRTFSARE